LKVVVDGGANPPTSTRSILTIRLFWKQTRKWQYISDGGVLESTWQSLEQWRIAREGVITKILIANDNKFALAA